MGYTADDLAALVREDRVHRSVYTDPAIFELELDRVFGRAWLFVGHDSQVPNPGDFVTTTLGRQPVVMARGLDGKVRVLYNRCGHRGAKVLTEERGNARQFRCSYHGWAFHPDGTLAGLPLPEDYPASFDLNDPAYAMMPMRHASYRGFVFATQSASAPDLETHLGQARIGFDEVCDRAPEGTIEFAGGCHRYEYGGNWKHQMENLADTYHPIACHESTVKKDGYQFQRRTGESGGQAKFFDQTGKPLVPLLGVWAFVNGHNSEASLPFHEEQTGEVFLRYRALLVAKHGEARTREILKPKRHNLSVYPTMDIIVLQNAVRVIRPLAVDRTEVRVYPMRLKGAPAEIFADHVRFLNQTHSASSFIQSDDVESFHRCQEGLLAEGPEWSVVARGVGREASDQAGVRFGERSSEIGQRNQHAAWVQYMTGAAASWEPARP